MDLKKKIVLISPFPPAQNPRLLKEYKFFKENGYKVTVLYSVRDVWANAIKLKNKDFIEVGGKQGSLLFHFTRLIHKLFNKSFALEFFFHRTSWLLMLKAFNIKADLYIAHNLAALPIAVKAAKFHKAKCGFDAEDFHRQEVTDDFYSFEYKSAKYLEDKYLPQVDYFTAASPLIAAEYKKLYQNLNPIIINNVFLNKFSILNSQFSIQNSPLKLFWFSQTIGKGRGLEIVIEAIYKLDNSNIELHLLGNGTTEIKEYFSSLFPEVKIFFYDPIPPDDIFNFAAQFDIGLALEQNSPFNRDICLTNKKFTYLTSGLAIIASETSAQKQFIEENPTIGKSFVIGDVEKLAEIINDFYYNRDSLNICKSEALKLAEEKYNWELESKKLIKIIQKL